MVFPAAGYVALAIEAVAQMSSQQPDIPSSYKLQNVKISTAIVLTDESETDMMFEMRATQGHILMESRWFSFTVSSVNASGEWTEHATEMVITEMSDHGKASHRMLCTPELTFTVKQSSL